MGSTLRCGEEIIANCPYCNIEIRGRKEFVVQKIMLSSPTLMEKKLSISYERPKYCYNCGKPFPWIEKAIESVIEVIKEDEKKLSCGELDQLHHDMIELSQDGPKVKSSAARFNKIIKKLSALTAQMAREIIVDIASDTAKKLIMNI
ncbi:MAG: DUF2321 domain-containing protein [Pseudomonadota bacterium]